MGRKVKDFGLFSLIGRASMFVAGRCISAVSSRPYPAHGADWKKGGLIIWPAL